MPLKKLFIVSRSAVDFGKWLCSYEKNEPWCVRICRFVL